MAKRLGGRARPFGDDGLDGVRREAEALTTEYKSHATEVREAVRKSGAEWSTLGLGNKVDFKGVQALGQRDLADADLPQSIRAMDAALQDIELARDSLRVSRGRVAAQRLAPAERNRLMAKHDDLLARADRAAQRLRQQRDTLDQDRAQADRLLGGLRNLGLGGAGRGGNASEVRRAFYEADPQTRVRLYRVLQEADRQAQQAPDGRARDLVRGATLERVADAVRRGGAPGRVDFEALDDAVPAQFVALKPDRIKDAAAAQEHLRGLDVYMQSGDFERLTVEEPRKAQQVRRLRREMQERAGELREEEKAQRRTAPALAGLRRRKASLEERIDAARNRGIEPRGMERELAQVERDLERLAGRKREGTLRFGDDGSRVGLTLGEMAREKVTDVRASLVRTSKKAARATSPVTEEVRDSVKTGWFGFVNKLRARRIRSAEQRYKESQRVANSGWWAAYYRLRNIFTPTVLFFTVLGVFFIPWGLGQFFGWLFFGAFAVGGSAFYIVLVEIFNFFSQAFMAVINVVGNGGAAVANAAGTFFNTTLLGQPYSPFYFSLTNVRLQPPPLIDPLRFFPTRFNANSWAAVLLDAAGLPQWGNLFRTGNERVMTDFTPIQNLIDRRLEKYGG